MNLCPPKGESIQEAKKRVLKEIKKLTKRAANGNVAIVIPEPLASIVQSMLEGEDMPDLWKSETDAGNWELIESPN